MNCASFFSGVGGIDLGFTNAGFEIIYANEFDKYPAETYECNWSMEVDTRDIHQVPTDEIPDFDIMLAGFPCQAFSVAGYREGFNDDRGYLFFDLIRILREKGEKKPSICFFENVKNLVRHDHGNTFRVIKEELENLGYHLHYQVLNACEYGNVPQNRERIYIVAFLDEKQYQNFSMPEKIPLTKSIRDVIDFVNPVEERYYYNPSDCYFYDKLKETATNQDTVYQWRRLYVRENKKNLVPTLTANMGTGGHNVPIILTDDGRYRKLTPRECFNVQGFPDTFLLCNQANGRLYKQAGNSVVVPVIERIAKEIRKVIGS